MLSPEVKARYTTTIGIECHVQLKTVSKLFSSVANDAREASANTLVSHIDFGLPGALPVLNSEALVLAVKAAFALNSQPQLFSKFDRKHYFYPDLPMGYQITQFDEPIILGGSVAIHDQGVDKVIGITRAHLEADAGKSTHPAGASHSLVDLNRAGTPLLEIVSEPDMHTAQEAKAYARELYLRMRFAEVSDCNLFYGNMRFDVNVSVSASSELGTRTETKNLNSFRAVEKTIEYEVARQIEQLERGEPIVQETRGWDDAKQRTFSQRIKENADDYRYMPDPDLPPVQLEQQQVDSIRSSMPLMPDVWRGRLYDSGIDKAHVESLLDAQLDFPQAQYLEVIGAANKQPSLAKQIANWIVNIDIPNMREEESGALVDRAALYSSVSELVNGNDMSSTKAKLLITDLLALPDLPLDIRAYAQSKGYIQISDESVLAGIVQSVLTDNPQAATDVGNGEMKAIGYLVGQVMKQSKGSANPQLVQRLIREQLQVEGHQASPTDV